LTLNDIIPQGSPDVHEMREIFFGDQAPAACGLFARPGQVSADLPAPDQCMRCGRPEGEHAAAPAGLGGLIAALIGVGTSISFVLDPDGVVAHVDVVGEDDTVATHTGIAATPLGALEAAAFGAGFAAGDAPSAADALAERVAELEDLVAVIDGRTSRSQSLLIRTLANALGVTDET
jgi:hypothetical protein